MDNPFVELIIGTDTPLDIDSDETRASDTITTQAAPVEQRRAGSHPEPSANFTQAGPDGIRYDFNSGCRVEFASDRKRRLILKDLDTGSVIYQSNDVTRSRFNSVKRYYVRFRIEVCDSDGLFFAHDYCCSAQNVLIAFPVGTMGDTLAWLPYAEKFRVKNGCHLTCAMSDLLIPLFREAYPEISFCTLAEIDPEKYYATYYMGLFFDDHDHHWQPTDFRLVGLHRTAGYILGVDPAEVAPRLAATNDTPPVPEPYVCIAVQASTHAKKWTNPWGWHKVVAFLKSRGYRVICIDREAVHGSGLVYASIPHGAEDETGERPLLERVRWLRHASFFIGTSSGLAWLAWAAGTRVVMISGFTHPTNEFQTPYRVFNHNTCNSCWNDVRVRFKHDDYLWCPRHANTNRQFECSRLITPEHVISMIGRIPHSH